MNEPFKNIDPTDLVKVSDLQLMARMVVQGLLTGIHRSPFYGSSIEFAQYRPYVQGDDPRFVDWSLFGRTDRLHVKQFHDETNIQCNIMIDGSASMSYTSHSITKMQYARILAACLVTILIQQKDETGLIAFPSEESIYIPPRNSPNHYRRILVELSNLEAEGEGDIEKALQELVDLIKPGGMVIFISDLLHEPQAIIDQLKLLRARRQEILLLQISDPAEQTFPFDHSVTLIDAESSAEQFAVPDLVREQYLQNRKQHFEYIRQECLPLLIDFKEFTTTEPMDHALRFFLHHRNRMLRNIRSRKSPINAGGI